MGFHSLGVLMDSSQLLDVTRVEFPKTVTGVESLPRVITTLAFVEASLPCAPYCTGLTLFPRGDLHAVRTNSALCRSVPL